MNMGAAATREQFATTPINPCGGGLSFWVNAIEQINRYITGISKVFSSVDSLSLSGDRTVSTFFHPSNSSGSSCYGCSCCNQCSNERQQDVGADQQELVESQQGKQGATNE